MRRRVSGTGPGSLLLRRIGAVSGGLLPLGGPLLCVCADNHRRAGSPGAPAKAAAAATSLPHLPKPFPNHPVLLSYQPSIRCHNVVAVPPQGSKGRPAHAVASSES